jgi:hypothetical protein
LDSNLLTKIQTSKIQRVALKALTNPTDDYKTREVLFGGAKNGGKSFLGSIFLHCNAILYPETSYFVARETRQDLIKFTIPTFYKFYKSNGLNLDDYCNYNGQTNVFHFKNGSRINLIDAAKMPSDPLFERFGSMEMTTGWIEEGGEIDELAYENLKLTIGRQNNEKYKITPSLLITCNPKKNWMYRNFYLPNKNNTLEPSKIFIQSLVTDNNFRAQGSETILESIKNKRDLLRLRYGEWEYDDDDNSLVSFEKINDLFTNNYVERTGRKILSCDIALLNDKSVLVVWVGLVIVELLTFQKINAEDLKNKIKEVANKHQIPISNIIYDGDGIGTYLGGYLPGAIRFNNNGNSGSSEYPNIKTRLAYMLAEFINKGLIYIECILSNEIKSQLVEEIQCLKSKESDKRYCLISKDEMKKIISRSPDLLDAIMYRLYFKITRNY